MIKIVKLTALSLGIMMGLSSITPATESAPNDPSNDYPEHNHLRSFALTLNTTYDSKEFCRLSNKHNSLMECPLLGDILFQIFYYFAHVDNVEPLSLVCKSLNYLANYLTFNVPVFMQLELNKASLLIQLYRYFLHVPSCFSFTELGKFSRESRENGLITLSPIKEKVNFKLDCSDVDFAKLKTHLKVCPYQPCLKQIILTEIVEGTDYFKLNYCIYNKFASPFITLSFMVLPKYSCISGASTRVRFLF